MVPGDGLSYTTAMKGSHVLSQSQGGRAGGKSSCLSQILTKVEKQNAKLVRKSSLSRTEVPVAFVWDLQAQ